MFSPSRISMNDSFELAIAKNVDCTPRKKRYDMMVHCDLMFQNNSRSDALPAPNWENLSEILKVMFPYKPMEKSAWTVKWEQAVKYTWTGTVISMVLFAFQSNWNHQN